MPIIRYKGENYTASLNDISDTELNYDSGDELEPLQPAEVPKLGNRETLKSFAQKVSLIAKNVRYLLKRSDAAEADLDKVYEMTAQNTHSINALDEEKANRTELTKVKGNAEAEYRGGNVNLTPENIGALNKNGDTANGKLFLKKGSMVNVNIGTSAVTGYVILAQIKVLTAYVDYPIFMKVMGRGIGPVDLCIIFSSTSSHDPNILYFIKYGFAADYPIYIKKIAESTWQICMRKRESYASGSVAILNYEILDRYEITFPNTQINDADFVVSEWREATLYGRIKEAEQLSALLSTQSTDKTATDYNYIGYKVSEADFKPLYNVNDGANYKQFYSRLWQHEIYGDYRTGQIALRGKNNGTFQAWRKVVDHLNYASLIPAATTTQSGLMTKEDKVNIESSILMSRNALKNFNVSSVTGSKMYKWVYDRYAKVSSGIIDNITTTSALFIMVAWGDPVDNVKWPTKNARMLIFPYIDGILVTDSNPDTGNNIEISTMSANLTYYVTVRLKKGTNVGVWVYHST